MTLPRFFPAFSARPSTRTDVIRALIGSLVCLLHWPRLTSPSLLSGVVKRAKYACAREIASHEIGHTRVTFLAKENVFTRASCIAYSTIHKKNEGKLVVGCFETPLKNVEWVLCIAVTPELFTKLIRSKHEWFKLRRYTSPLDSSEEPLFVPAEEKNPISLIRKPVLSG